MKEHFPSCTALLGGDCNCYLSNEPKTPDKFTQVLAVLRTVVEAGKTATERPWRVPHNYGRANACIVQDATGDDIITSAPNRNAAYITLAANLGDKVCEGLIVVLEWLHIDATDPLKAHEDFTEDKEHAKGRLNYILNIFPDDV